MAMVDILRIYPLVAYSVGRIMGLAGARKLYTTSNGGVTLRATTHIEVGVVTAAAAAAAAGCS